MLALITIIITFCLINLGGFVHNSESSLACPDWPLCYGQFFPEMEGQVAIEHGHRLLASLVGLLNIFLVVQAYRLKNSLLKKWAWISLGMVITQGLLGGLTVIYRLPTIVSSTHLALSVVYFCTLLFYFHQWQKTQKTFFILSRQTEEKLRGLWKTQVLDWTWLALVMVYLQMILGAFMRHSGAGAACGLGPASSLLCTDIQLNSLTWWPSLAAGQVHMFHRYFAILVTLVVFIASFKLWAFSRKARVFKREFQLFSLLPVVLVIGQVLLGVFSVATYIGNFVTTAHLGVAVLLLGVIWKTSLNLKELQLKLFPEGKSTFLTDLLDLTKPRLTALVMTTVFAGMCLAPGEISFFEALSLLIGTHFLVSGACALNCYFEREIDARMERTRDRPLPAGRLGPNFVHLFGWGLVVLSFPLLLKVGSLTLLLGIVAMIFYLFFYTPLKLKTPLALFVGAVPGAIPPVMGWTAVTNQFDLMALSLFLILFIWQLPHFLSISLVYSDDYRSGEIKTFPEISGVTFTKRSIVLYTFLLLVLGVIPSYLGHASVMYRWFSLGLGGLFLLLSLQGLFLSSENGSQKKWAKNYFWGSIVYLPLLLGVMLFWK